MTSVLLAFLLAPLAAPFSDSPAAELRYTGSVSPLRQSDDAQPGKRFSLYELVELEQGRPAALSYVLDERGSGGWGWAERFGRFTTGGESPAAVRLLYEHEGRPTPIRLPFPIFQAPQPLAPMAAWKDGGESYEVGKDTAKLQNRECWAIEVSNNFGRKRMLWVDKSSQAIVVLEERVFMGQGNEFTLRMQLESAEGLDKDQLARLRQPLDMLLKLQNDLKRPDDATDWEMSDAQLAIAAKELPAIEKASEGTPFSRLVSFAQRDTKNQLQRGDEVVQLAQKSIGRPAPDFSLPLLDGGTFEHKDLAGKITILHFWEYQGEPLVEPYGQVGYLDFLMSRRKKLGVQAIGVAVDNRFAKKELAPQAARSVGKLKSFMNLTYPIAGDGGAVLEKFGDPRRFEAKLPLWIVIGPDGKIAGYHVGYYDIKPDEGLRQLDEIVVKLIQAERAKDTK